MSTGNDKLKQLQAEQERLLFRLQQSLLTTYHSAFEIGGVKKAISNGNDGFFFANDDTANKSINRLLSTFAKRMDYLLFNGIEKSWENGKENISVILESIKPKNKDEKKAFDQIIKIATQSNRTNTAKAFYNEKRGGFSISDSVWNLAGNAKKEIEIILQNGIKEGNSAEEIQKSLKGYLNEPDKLFRRVLNKETGEMELSKAAQKYKPGKGVYRSAYKNVMRLVRTELKAANCEAIWQSAQNNPLITGWKLVLSNNHTTLYNGKKISLKDICDNLQGIYPKWFKFRGWHPQCRCEMLPILATSDERKELYKKIFDGKRDEWKTKAIDGVPQGFKDWVEANKERQKNGGNVPYFVRDNFVNGNLADGLKYLSIQKQTKPIKTEQQKAEIQSRWNTRVANMKYNERLQEIKTKYGKESEAIGKLISHIEHEIESGAIFQKVDSMMNKLNHKLQVKVAWNDRLEVNRLETLLVDVKELKTKFDMPTLQSVFKSIEAKLATWENLTLDEQIKKIKFEINEYLGTDKFGVQSKYPTWKAAQDAYKKQLGKVEYKKLEYDIDLLIDNAKLLNPKSKSKLDVLLNNKIISKDYVNKVTIEINALLLRRNKLTSGNLVNISDDEIAKLLNEFENETVEMADKRLRGLTESIWNTLTLEEKNILTKYTQTYHYLNEPLRGLPFYGDTKPNADHIRDLPILTKVLSKFKTQSNMVVRRGVENYTIPELGYGLSNVKVGDVFTDKAFLSTSVNSNKGFHRYYNLVILVPKGSQGFYAEPFSHYTDDSNFSYNNNAKNANLWDGVSVEKINSEQEWIGQRGSKFKVLKKEGNTIYLQMIGQLQ